MLHLVSHLFACHKLFLSVSLNWFSKTDFVYNFFFLFRFITLLPSALQPSRSRHPMMHFRWLKSSWLRFKIRATTFILCFVFWQLERLGVTCKRLFFLSFLSFFSTLNFSLATWARLNRCHHLFSNVLVPVLKMLKVLPVMHWAPSLSAISTTICPWFCVKLSLNQNVNTCCCIHWKNWSRHCQPLEPV